MSAPIAYLVSRYPLVSHVFILREVLALRRQGIDVRTFSVRAATPADLLSEDDRDAFATTHALVPPTPLGLLGAHLRAVVTRPRRYLSTLRLALALRPPGARAALWQLLYFGEAALMWRECARRGIRHIHAHHANVAADVALLAAHLGGRRWSWSFTLHGPTELFDVVGHRLADKALRARFVVCISDYSRSQLLGLIGSEHAERLHVVHCGVEPRRLVPVERDGGGEILSVGRAVAAKGQAILIEALAALARAGSDARLTLIGDGPELPALRAAAERLGVSERVVFAGAVGQDEIGGYYDRADVFALSSFAEGLPVVLMEAMASGLPVVATRITGVPELVEEGRSGLLVAPGRSDELADALAGVLSRPAAERAAMGSAGRAKVLAEFDVDAEARRLAAHFRALA